MSPRFGNPLKGRNTPPVHEALAALGLGDGGKGFKGDRGSKGPDEIEMTQEELQMARKEAVSSFEYSGEKWKADELYRWCIGELDRGKTWTNEQFYITPKGMITRRRRGRLTLNGFHITHLPPNLSLDLLKISRTQVRKLPPQLAVKEIWLIDTPVTHIPEQSAIEKIVISASQTELRASAEAIGVEVKII